MRTYGEGFIIADQSPGLLDMSAIRNTNTKIILRLPEKSDRELIGYAAGLDDEQIKELSKLRRGVCAVYQNNWVEPVLIQVAKCSIVERKYVYNNDKKNLNFSDVYSQVINFLLQGRIDKELKFDLDEIVKNLDNLNLSSKNILFLHRQIEEYQENGKLLLWDLENYNILAEKITNLLGVRDRVENIVVKIDDFRQLDTELSLLISSQFPNIEYSCKRELIKCLLKDMTLRDEERHMREKIYIGWCENIEREGIL